MKIGIHLLNTFFDERDRWFLWLPIFMLAGICSYYALPKEPDLAWLSLTPLTALLMLLSKNYPAGKPLLTVMLTLFLGFNACQIETYRLKTPLLEEKIGPVSITGTLIRAEAMPKGARLTLKKPWIRGIPKEERPHIVRIKTRTNYEDLPPAGARVNVWGPLWPPSEPVAPHGYNFRKHAYYTQIGASGMSYVEPREWTSKYPPRFFWDGFLILFEKARRALTLAVYERLEDPIKSMTATLLSGSQSGIDRGIMKDMRLSGLTHLLSISGIHVSMMALLIYVPLRFLLALWPYVALRIPIKKVAAFAAIIATSLYTILVGADAPTVRSALMTGIMFFAVLSDRKALSLRLVMLAAMAIMVITPSASMGPSFQMSFAAVLAMIAAYEKKLDETVKQNSEFALPYWLLGLKAITITSLVATAATAPYTIFHFQTFSFYGVFANMLAIPLTSFWVMPCLLLTYITAPFGLSGLFIDGAGLGVEWIITIAHVVANWPLSQIPFPPMPGWIVIAMSLGGLWLCLWRKRWRFLGLIPLFLGLTYPLFYKAPTIFISEEKPITAIHLSNDRFIVLGKRKENFTTSQWRQQAGWPEATYLLRYKEASFNDGELSCSKTSCLYKNGKTSIAFLAPPRKKDKKPMPPACPKADIIVGFWDLSHCKASTIIDKETLRAKGAHSITFEGNKPVISYVRKAHVKRPWTSER